MNHEKYLETIEKKTWKGLVKIINAIRKLLIYDWDSVLIQVGKLDNISIRECFFCRAENYMLQNSEENH